MLLELLAGAACQTLPENGTWWDEAVGTTRFERCSYTAGGGVRLNADWSLELQDLGHEYSHYVDGGGVHYDGQQHPRWLGAFYEPGHDGGGLFGRVGLGAYKSDFVINVTQQPSGPYNSGNNHTALGYAVGGGYALQRGVDVILDARYVAANGDDTPGNFKGLGKFAVALYLRGSF